MGRLPAAHLVEREVADDRGAPDRVGPRHRHSHPCLVELSSLAVGILPHVPDPLRDQSRLDPDGEPLHRLPDDPRHPYGAEGAQCRPVQGQRPSCWGGPGPDDAEHRGTILVGEVLGRHVADEVGSFTQRRQHHLGILTGERSPDAKVAPGGCPGRQGLPSRPGKPQTLGPTTVSRSLRQVGCGQRQVEPKPVQRDQPQRQEHVLPTILFGEASGAVGGPAQGPEQPQLVGRALGVEQDEAPEQRQGAGAIVGQAERQVRPPNLRTAERVLSLDTAHHLQPMVPRQALDLVAADLVGASTVVRTLSQGHHQEAARTQQRHQLAEGAGTFGGGYVLPDRARQHDVGGEAQPQRGRERRQAVVQPPHPGRVMEPLPFGPHGGRRLDGDDLVSGGGEPGGVAPGPGADVDHQRRLAGQEVRHPGVELPRVERLVADGDLGGVGVVPVHRDAAPTRRGLPWKSSTIDRHPAASPSNDDRSPTCRRRAASAPGRS